MDIILSLIVLVVTFPAMLIAMLAVKLTSKGPIFFKQKRIGEKEIPFTLLKLRTMEVGSDKKEITRKKTTQESHLLETS